MNYNTNKEVYFDIEYEGLTIEILVTNCNFDYSYDSGNYWTPPSSDFELIDVDFDITDRWDAEGEMVAWDKELHTELYDIIFNYVNDNWEKFENYEEIDN